MSRHIRVQKSDASKFVRKFRIQPNSVIAFTQGAITEKGVDDLAVAIKKLAIPGVIILVVEDVTQMDVLDEKEMNKAGWFRMGAIQDFVRRVRTAAATKSAAGEDITPEEIPGIVAEVDAMEKSNESLDAPPTESD